MRARERKSVRVGEVRLPRVVARNLLTPFEWILVRQKSSRSYLNRSRNLGVDDFFRVRQCKESFLKVEGCESSSRRHVTFFFNNFPTQCSVKTLWMEFSKAGRVLDIFCPQKRDKLGKPFGFVRFPEEYNTEQFLEVLNNIWIESYKLRVFFPKFERKKAAINQKEIVQK